MTNTYEVPQESRDLRDMVRRLAQEKIAPRAGDIDRESKYPWDVRKLLAEHDILGLPFDDLSGGFKLWRASTLAELDFDSMLSTGYAFRVETTQLAYLMGKRIEEVPFVFSERVAGASKMTLAVSLEGIRVTFALRRRARGRRAGLIVT